MKRLALLLSLTVTLPGFANSERVSPATLWPDHTRLLILGESHTSAVHSRMLLDSMPELKAAGMTVFAVELPQTDQRAIDRFMEGRDTLDKLSRNLWQPFEKLPEGYQLKLRMIEWARDNGVKVIAIDASRGILYQAASAQMRALQEGMRTFVDVHGEREVMQRGLIPHHQNLTGPEAVREGWRIWLHVRSREMAKNLAKILEQTPGRVVALVGAMHTGLIGYRPMLLRAGHDIRATPDDGIEDMLPENLRGKTHTALLLGGVVSGENLHTIEAYIAEKGLGDKVAVAKNANIRSPEGAVSAVDSFIYVPFVRNPTPLAAKL